MSDNDATDIGKAREEMSEAIREAMKDLGPALQAMSAAIVEIGRTFGPVLKRARVHAKKVAQATANLHDAIRKAEGA